MKNLIFLLVVLASSLSSKVYDCFIFYNELELLEIRFNELYDKVDKFVLVESAETFRGTSKPFYFEENKERYAKFLDKVIHVKVEERLDVPLAWDRENYQRNQIMRGLADCRDADMILVSDADEIVRADKIDEMMDAYLKKGRIFFGFEQDHYRFYLNTRSATIWMGTTALQFGFLKKVSPQWMRGNVKGDGSMKFITRGGWHFTYLGGESRNIKKLESFSHIEYDTPDYKSQSAIRKALAGDCRVVKIDSSFPKFVRDNIPLMEKWGFLLK
ncbi:MAG TPA: hypothetical protein VLE89_08020 [Chlamydiales bacterium]|nr:hypothetical protein [Chlamydiales bacterium]